MPSVHEHYVPSGRQHLLVGCPALQAGVPRAVPQGTNVLTCVAQPHDAIQLQMRKQCENWRKINRQNSSHRVLPRPALPQPGRAGVVPLKQRLPVRHRQPAITANLPVDVFAVLDQLSVKRGAERALVALEEKKNRGSDLKTPPNDNLPGSPRAWPPCVSAA